METRRHKAVTNEVNPRDRNTRGGHVVQDKKHKGALPKASTRMKGMGRAKPLATGKKK